MTDDERIERLNDWFKLFGADDPLATDVRWLLGEYRRLKARCGESGLTEFKELELDAARWRYCERAAEPSDGNDAEPWWVLTACGPTFAEAVDAAREQVTTDWSGHQGGA